MQEEITSSQSHLAELKATFRSIVMNPRVKIDLSKTQYPVVKEAADLFKWRRWSREGTISC